MKINGEFILREVAGECILVPVGQTALKLNGIITMDAVGAEIWKGLEAGLDGDAILEKILQEFEVSREVAKADLEEFLEKLKNNQLIRD